MNQFRFGIFQLCMSTEIYFEFKKKKEKEIYLTKSYGTEFIKDTLCQTLCLPHQLRYDAFKSVSSPGFYFPEN